MQRKKDEEDLDSLRGRIANRKIVRDQQIQARNEKLKAREAQLALEKDKREAIENRRKAEEEERKKATMAAIQYATSNPKKRLQKVKFAKSFAILKSHQKGGNKQEKKKILAARRKNGNIDHLTGPQLAEKAQEFFKHFTEINEDKYNLEITLQKHQYTLKVSVKVKKVFEFIAFATTRSRSCGATEQNQHEKIKFYNQKFFLFITNLIKYSEIRGLPGVEI